MKILIAEDEYYARQRLIKIIRECDMEAELAAAVENGREAVDFLEQNTDVELTDIIMPRMNGLELAEYIHVNMPYIQVVIVSGYEEFDYARKAIEYEVKQYIIKPVKRELLLRVLRQLEEKQESFRREVEAGVLERLKKLPNGYTSSKQVLTKKELMQIHMPQAAAMSEETPCRIFVIQLERTMNTRDAGILHKICAQKLDSRLFYGTANIYDAYKECLYAMNIRLMKGWNKIFEYQLPHGGNNYFLPRDDNALAGALQLSDAAKAAELVHGLLNKREMLDSGDVNAYYDMILNILRSVNRYYRSLYNENEAMDCKVEIMFSRRYDLYVFKHPEELEEYLMDIIREICDQEQNSLKNGGNAIIRDILHYVEQNYQYDLSLQELAEKKYFMNSSYLSRLFKSAVGQTFSRYVIELRIKKARELLKDKTMKINDVAAQVGYNNTSHFIQSFKKLCGCTPEEYRNQL